MIENRDWIPDQVGNDSVCHPRACGDPEKHGFPIRSGMTKSQAGGSSSITHNI